MCCTDAWRSGWTWFRAYAVLNERFIQSVSLTEIDRNEERKGGKRANITIESCGNGANAWTHPMGGGGGSALVKPSFPSNQYVFIKPFPLISTGPRGSNSNSCPVSTKRFRVASDRWIRDDAPKHVWNCVCRFFSFWLNLCSFMRPGRFTYQNFPFGWPCSQCRQKDNILALLCRQHQHSTALQCKWKIFLTKALVYHPAATPEPIAYA